MCSFSPSSLPFPRSCTNPTRYSTDYSATLFAAAGVKNSGGVAIVTAATNMTGTIIGVLFLDRWGRRRTLLTALPVAIVALFMVAMCFHFMTLPTGGRVS